MPVLDQLARELETYENSRARLLGEALGIEDAAPGLERPAADSDPDHPRHETSPCLQIITAARMGRARSLDHRQELLPRRGIVAETAKHAARYEISTRLADTSRSHAVMCRLDDDADAVRLQDIIDRIRDLRRQTLLDL